MISLTRKRLPSNAIGFAQPAGQVIVCDGTPETDERLKRVL
ncbi:MAG: hypothetical protein O7G85_16755 [Planctomycetota bacterium]|nr:hypothetical protein [Planctomycetota bacterium]